MPAIQYSCGEIRIKETEIKYIRGVRLNAFHYLG